MNHDLVKEIVELIKRTSIELPSDLTKSIKSAKDKEKINSISFYVLDTITSNLIGFPSRFENLLDRNRRFYL